MNEINSDYLKLAIQKEGRLTDETLDFLRSSGLRFETYKKRLFSKCLNFPMEILYIRDDDIGEFVSQGTVDLGIIGQNLLYELRPKVKKLLNLRYGFCSLIIAVPKESEINNISKLKNKKIATSYPISAKRFFEKEKIDVEIVKISGSVEAAPSLGIASGIVDLVSTGSTLVLNDLKIIDKIYNSEAVLIANPRSAVSPNNKSPIEKLVTRFKGVLSAKNYKYILMNAPERILPKLKKIIPGLKSPTFSRLAKPGWISVQSVVKEDIFWETMERLKKTGASEIMVLPIEKMII